MKSMTLGCIAYVLLAALTVAVKANPATMSYVLTLAAIAWALLMWREGNPPDDEIV